ncbi:MAG: hypothetical protein IKS83_05880 [Victivallales bacterium]|nr:hypothetical protein [Victivallales bacterium]
MAKKTEAFPSSLELLLDTMCNTFGGIMFIAIALVIVTQFASKSVLDSMKKMPTPEEKAALLEQLETAREEWRETERQQRNAQLAKMGIRPAEMEVIRRILETREKLLTAMGEEENAEQRYQKARERNRRLEDQEMAYKEDEQEMRDRLLAIQTDVQAMERRLNAATAEKERLQRELEDWEQRLADTKPAQTITFSMERERLGGDETMVFLRRNRLYLRMDTTERELGGREVEIMFPGKGRGTSLADCNAILDGLHGGFVHIWVDDQSFDALVAVRAFLRGRGVPVSWAYTEDFRFFYSSNVTRDVSQ